MQSLDRKFLFVTGKGGVGKTTVSAAAGLALAERGRRVLIAMTDGKERYSTLFGVPPLSEQITALAPRLWAVRMTPEGALREYGQMTLRSRAAYDAVFDNRYVQTFFAAVPGLHQWAMLGKAWYHSTETTSDGSPRFDTVIFDAPATGHGVEMLRVPKVIVEVVPPGILRRDAERAWAMFRDPSQTGVVVVTLPEEMPTNESLELLAIVQDELGLPVARLIINGMLEQLFDHAEREQLFGLADLDLHDPTDHALYVAGRRALRESVQERSVARLQASTRVGMTHLPLLFTDASGLAAVQELARHLAGGA